MSCSLRFNLAAPETVTEFVVSKARGSNSTFNISWKLPAEGTGWDAVEISCVTEGGKAGICDGRNIEMSFSNQSG